MNSNYYRVPAVALSVLFGATLAAALVSAATTISTNIQTDGTLSVTGTSTLFNEVDVPYLMATSTTATSTLSGGLNAGGSYGLTVQQNGQIFANGQPGISRSEMTIHGFGGTPLEIHANVAESIAAYVHSDLSYRAPYINLYKSGGSESTPTAVTYVGYDSSNLGGITWGGYDGTSYAGAAFLAGVADENWTPTAHGSHLTIYFNKTGVTTQNAMVQFGGKDSSGVNGSDALFYWPVNFFSNGATGIELYGGGSGNLVMTKGDGTSGALLSVNGPIQVGTTTAASLSTCNSSAEGKQRAVIDSSAATWGATVTGGGSNHVLAYCDGTNWTVMGN